MVIHFTLASLPERLSFGALTDLGAVTTPTVVGAWMTRIWLGAFGEANSGRRTADVDVQVDSAESPGSGELIALLEERDYRRDSAGYPFRLSRRVGEGTRIVDLLVDREARGAIGFPVEGLDLATRITAQHELGAPGVEPFCVRVPSLQGAFVLRCLALAGGPSGLKFEDYVQDAVQLGRLVSRNDAARQGLEELRSRAISQRLRDVMAGLFSDADAPGSRAAARLAPGNPDLASRQASVLVRKLIL